MLENRQREGRPTTSASSAFGGQISPPWNMLLWMLLRNKRKMISADVYGKVGARLRDHVVLGRTSDYRYAGSSIFKEVAL